MKYCLITFRSVTPAQRAEGMLKKAGMDCHIQRTPKWMEEQGCGYSLRIPWHSVQVAVDLLRSREVPFRKIYLWNEGRMEELSL